MGIDVGHAYKSLPHVLIEVADRVNIIQQWLPAWSWSNMSFYNYISALCRLSLRTSALFVCLVTSKSDFFSRQTLSLG
jgi:hypothetical protein